MNLPPAYLEPLLYSLESITLDVWEDFPSLTDKDVEYAYEKLRDYYKQLASGKEVNEPLTPSERRQALIDELLNMIEFREESDADLDLINNPDITLGAKMIPSLPILYAICFKRLQKSARLWRKEGGPKGYLNFIKRHVL